MNLHTKRQQRARDNHPIRIGLIGTSKFGSMYLAQLSHTPLHSPSLLRTPGMHLVAIAGLSPDAARASLALTG